MMANICLDRNADLKTCFLNRWMEWICLFVFILCFTRWMFLKHHCYWLEIYINSAVVILMKTLILISRGFAHPLSFYFSYIWNLKLYFSCFSFFSVISYHVFQYMLILYLVALCLFFTSISPLSADEFVHFWEGLYLSMNVWEMWKMRLGFGVR